MTGQELDQDQAAKVDAWLIWADGLTAEYEAQLAAEPTRCPSCGQQLAQKAADAPSAADASLDTPQKLTGAQALAELEGREHDPDWRPSASGDREDASV